MSVECRKAVTRVCLVLATTLSASVGMLAVSGPASAAPVQDIQVPGCRATYEASSPSDLYAVNWGYCYLAGNQLVVTCSDGVTRTSIIDREPNQEQRKEQTATRNPQPGEKIGYVVCPATKIQIKKYNYS